MGNNQMRGPLIQSGIVLVVFMLLVSLTTASPDATIFGSLGTIIVGAIKLVWWAFAMCIALAACIAVMIGIFIGAVKLTNKQAASDIYAALKVRLVELIPAMSCMTSCCSSPSTSTEKTLRAEDVQAMINTSVAAGLAKASASQKEMQDTIDALEKKCAALEQQLSAALEECASTERVDELAEALDACASAEALDQAQAAVTAMEAKVEKLAAVESCCSDLDQKLAAYASVERVDGLADTMDSFADVEALEQVQGAVTAMKTTLAELAEAAAAPAPEVEVPSAETILGDVPARLSAAEEALTALNKKADDLEKACANVGKSEAAPVVQAEKSGGGAAHRLFTYFDDASDQAKIEKLVASTLKKDMTYAQVMAFLIKEMGKEKGQIIADHPSLAKDYIRQCRRSVA